MAIFSLVLAASPLWAKPDFEWVEGNLETSGKVSRQLHLPEPAVENSRVINLGTAWDPQSGKMVEGYAIIRYKDKKAKPDKPGKPDRPGKEKESQCYEFLAKGAKWKSVEPWEMNPQNVRDLNEGAIYDNLAVDIEKWENAAEFNILGNGSQVSNVLVADTSSPDGKNEAYFDDISSAGAVGVTIIWGIFSGPPSLRELVEWDQVYDDADYDWSLNENGESDKMDFESIATHELGHSVGMGDLYETSCIEETMYGYVDYGEINKRDLNAGDIAGVSKLY